MDTLIQDLKYALRMMVRNPGFLAAAVLCLALGIGATTGIFSVVNAVLLRPLPYKHPEQLARVYTEFPTFPNGGLHKFTMSSPEWVDLKRDIKSFESFDIWFNTGVNVSADTEAVRAQATYVSGGVMETLGVSPIMGRAITPDDDKPGAPLVVDISYGLWQRLYGGQSNIINRETTVNGRKCNIIGVMPKGFTYPPGQLPAAEIYAPLQIDPANPGGRSSHNFLTLARLKPGVTIAQAQSELNSYVNAKTSTSSAAGAANRVHSFNTTNHTLVAFVLQGEIVDTIRPALLMLLGAVAFVLLIGCVNVANLLLARAEARRREIAIRGALGAGTARLARQFATEGILLSLIGGALGLLLAYGGLKLIVLTNAGSIPRADEISLDLRVLFFTFGTSILTGILFGFAPLFGAQISAVTDSLKDTAGSSTGTVAAQLFRRVLVAGELALAMVLLIGCGLMIRAFWKLQEVHTGVDTRNVITMRLSLPRATYSTPESADSFYSRLEERASRIPGVEAAGLASGLPPIRNANMNDFMIEGFVPKQGGPIQNVDFYQVVSPGYLKAMGVRVIEGRAFTESDAAGGGAPETVMVNHAMANTFWPGQSPVGRRVRQGSNSNWATVIGVVEDAKNAGLDKPAGTEVYLPYRQPTGLGSRTFYLILRGKSDPRPLVADVRRMVQDMDASIPLSAIALMEDVVSDAQARPRFLALLLTLFSGVALAIATVGIYGVISYTVARRSKEFGLRMALGASSWNVLGLVMKQGTVIVISGAIAGLLTAFGLTRLMGTLLYGITATDPATFVSIPLLLVAVALIATYIPARRATRVDPMESLRYE